MKKLMLIMLLLCCAAFVIAEECIKAPNIYPADVPFTYDPNTAPERVIHWLEISATSEISLEVKACDPDGDPYVITPVIMPDGMTFDPNTNYFHWTPETPQIGTHWIVFRVIDIPPFGSEPKGDIGATIINVTPRLNNPPCLLPF